MDLVDLGDSGVRVSRVGLGCNNFGGRVELAGTRAVVEEALAVGVSFFDTADIYGGSGGSERMLGEILEGRRHEVTIATKFGKAMGDGATSRGSPEYLRRALDASLERLRTDYVDLYYLHEPDPSTPIAETLGALDELVRAGKVRAIGCSNVSAAEIAQADEAARTGGYTRFVAVQNYYNLLRRDDDEDVVPLCRRLGIAYVPYFPLASGLLTGKYRRGRPAPEGTRLSARPIDDETFTRVEDLERFAEARGHSLLDLAVSALASMPGVPSVIAGATKPEQVRANAAAAAWHLSAAELEALAAL